MIDLKNISIGLINLAKSELGIADENVEKLAIQRYTICLECPIYNKELGLCDKSKGGCGCAIKLKVRSNSHCPQKKW